MDHADMLDEDFEPFVPSSKHIDSPEPEPAENQHQSKRARVEEVEDEETYPRYVKEFPTRAEELGDGKMAFEEIFEDQSAKGESPWAPFTDKDEWELARWLVKNVNQRATEEFLKMPGVSVSTDKSHDMKIYQVRTCRPAIASNPASQAIILSRRR
jgi:hypothetical protein